MLIRLEHLQQRKHAFEQPEIVNSQRGARGVEQACITRRCVGEPIWMRRQRVGWPYYENRRPDRFQPGKLGCAAPLHTIEPWEPVFAPGRLLEEGGLALGRLAAWKRSPSEGEMNRPLTRWGHAAKEYGMRDGAAVSKGAHTPETSIVHAPKCCKVRAICIPRIRHISDVRIHDT